MNANLCVAGTGPESQFIFPHQNRTTLPKTNHFTFGNMRLD